MRYQPATIYENDPIRLESLTRDLVEVHNRLVPDDPKSPLTHTAHYDENWELSLTSSRAGVLRAASIKRAGQEKYEFTRTSRNWVTESSHGSFADAHFGNLVTMATKEGLEWYTKPKVA